jgi:hypothetical protein
MEVTFHENKLWSTPLRDLGVRIEGTPLEPVIAEFTRELEAVGIRKLKPHFYLTTDWVVHDDTIAIGIPFYLARPDLMALHLEREGHIEGAGGPAELLRYLRHEMGHVVNYAYKLFDREDWVDLFGPMTQPYEDEYRPKPFSRSHVLHLPGWYAQKHPDEDWAETFAVWMTPNLDWRAAYADWPMALRKLNYCDRTLADLRDRDPAVTAVDTEWDVANLTDSVADLYEGWAFPEREVKIPGIDGALRAVFEDGEGRPAAELIRRTERDLLANVYRWTGHFPERTRLLLRHLAERAEALKQVYDPAKERPTLLALATLVTALAMNHVHHGRYLP